MNIEDTPIGRIAFFFYSAWGAACLISLSYAQITDTTPYPKQVSKWDLEAQGCKITSEENGQYFGIDPSVATCPDGSRWRPVYDSIYFVAER